MAVTFQKATKKKARLRLALMGVSGSGKTYSALRIAKGLGRRVAVIDSERASASKYADRFEFDTVEVSSGNPRDYVEAIKAAGAAGYDVLVIDSLSHAWEGREGSALQLVDDAKARNKGNQWTAWRDVTPLHNALIDAILMSKCHVIATMRSKMKHVQELDEKGKSVIRKVGMEAVQRAGMEYEFDVVGDLEEATLVISKSRCPDFTKAVIREPDEVFGARLRSWLDDGVEGVLVPLVDGAAIGALGTGAAKDVPPASVATSPKERAAIEIMRFGPHKGERIENLSMEQLRAALVVGWEKTGEAPTAPWAKVMREQLEAIERELAERKIGAAESVASAGEVAQPEKSGGASAGGQRTNAPMHLCS